MNPGRGLWPVRCAPIGSVAVGSVLWRCREGLRCTAIVKVTLSLTARGGMSRINPTPICRRDDYLHGVPSLAVGCEIAPRMRHAEATLVGHAYAYGSPVTKRSVRLMVVRSDRVLLDKTLYVYGDRDQRGIPQPFTKLRIGYERALGGLDHPENPIGIGLDEGSSRQPNILDPSHPWQTIAGFGPRPSRFPERRKQRGGVPAELIEGGIAEYPPDFDWDYFQAAPADQRLPSIDGDEWLMLEGLCPADERIYARLPRVRALCRIYGRADWAPEWVELTADQFHIEPDHTRCSLLWRGAFAVPSERSATSLVLAGAVQEGDEPLHWPADIAELDAWASPAPDSTEIPGRWTDELQATAPRADRGPPGRSLGLGYRLGEQKLELGERGRAFPSEPVLPAAVVPPPPSIAGPAPWRVSEGGADRAVPSTPNGLGSTDEMADPELAAAEDAGLGPSSDDRIDVEDGEIELGDA